MGYIGNTVLVKLKITIFYALASKLNMGLINKGWYNGSFFLQYFICILQIPYIYILHISLALAILASAAGISVINDEGKKPTGWRREKKGNASHQTAFHGRNFLN